ncbi:glycoside hydrolase family 2 TIM barrel-domain containing protein [Pedobacter lusitanus]|nr:glycoside hydrolase family 2 TIM barrel-domain containing protein [Pedobacter lusitanus]
MSKKILFLFVFVILAMNVSGQEQAYELPGRVIGVKRPLISLNGEWQFKFDTGSGWDLIHVPAEAVMQGYGIEHDKSFFYKKEFLLPADFKGKKIVLRFDGVYSQAILSVNGKTLRTHKGGFSRWESDITPYVSFEKPNTVSLEIQDRLDDISYASGYAHHPIGGILRDVTLFATPVNSIHDFGVETDLENDFRDGLLKLSYNAEKAAGTTIQYVLLDKHHQPVPQTNRQFTVKDGQNVNSFRVSNPLKWDAEHPDLYRLVVKVKKDGKDIYSFSKAVGFREIKIVANQMLVNGKPVKLRGANRHDLHPVLGRVSTPYYDSLDVKLLKESNINFIRTSHYPPSERFVELCNRFGIYVEVETSVCFVDTYRQKNYAPGATQDNPDYTAQYLSQCREMVNTFRSHPAVVIWSIGNESQYGSNFKQSRDYVKGADKTRPVIWSYPGTQSSEDKIYDILSMHYQDVDGNLTQYGKTTKGYEGSEGIPALFDEWAHPACYTYQTLRDDPNIREFWGISLDMMWGRLFPTKGGLGGAIWGYVDETFNIPTKLKKGIPFWNEFSKTAKPADFQGHAVGYGEWGIVDVWRRPKPEFWSVKKAQSPIRILDEGKVIKNFIPNQKIQFSVYNRFDHTFLNEVKLEYTYENRKKTITLPNINPHKKGHFELPAENWKAGKSVLMNFVDRNGLVIDTYEYYFGERPVSMPVATHRGALTLVENAAMYLIKGDGFEIPVSKASGLIEHATSNGKVFIKKGPFLNIDVNLNHLTGAEVRKSANKFLILDQDWKKTALKCEISNGVALISIEGTYQGLKAYFNITLNESGELTTNYHTVGEPNGYLREIGLKYYMPDDIDQLDWKRNGYWNYYPEGDFAGNDGETHLYESKQVAYGVKPVQSWGQDTRNYYYWSDKGARSEKPLTNKAKSMKENIYYYTLSGARLSRISVISPLADVSCRIDRMADEQLILYINNKWDYPEIAWGNYCKSLAASPCSGSIMIRF